MGERFGSPGIWQFPQGGVEEGTPIEENVIRETGEELGLSPDKFEIVMRFNSVNEYEWRTPPKYAHRKWRGQSQSFWLLRFLGNDSDIRLDTHEQELACWRWCSPAEIRTLAEPVRFEGYEEALREFEHKFLKDTEKKDSGGS